MLFVMQCAKKKKEGAGKMKQTEGSPVTFVSDPSKALQDAERDPRCVYMRPDDICESGETWRKRLEEYNARYRETGANPLCLLPAWELYSNPVYGELVEAYGTKNVYLHSAGWGLIPSDFLIPDYNITFSSNSNYPLWSRRREHDSYADFCLIPSNSDGPIVFLGGKDYVPLFSRLTQNARYRKIVFYRSQTPPEAPGCELRRYHSKRKQNWHYECAKKLIGGNITI